MSTPLETNAMISRLAVKSWPATKFDPAVTERVITQHQAAENAARVNKQLIAKTSMKAIRNAIARAKHWHNTLTLPWGDHGDRLLPVDMHPEYTRRIDRCIDQLEQARQDFLNQYLLLVDEARNTLGQMFDASDYPNEDEVAHKFGIAYEINPVPSSNHFIVDLDQEFAEKIKADLDRRAQVKLDNAMVQLAERIEQSLRRLIDRLGVTEKGKPKRIHATALEAIQQLAEAVPSMNLTSDTRLTEISQRLRNVLRNVEIDDLRHQSKRKEAVQMVDLRRKKLSEELNSIATAYFGNPVTP